MPELDRYIPGVPCWIDTSQPDPDAAVAFYRDLFGWDVEDVMPAGSDEKYFMARIRGRDVAGIGGVPEGAPPMAMWNTYVWVQSADETAAKVKDAGGSVIAEPFDVMDAGRMAVFSDPEGAVFCVWQPNRHRGAQIVNEPSSLNFNGLNTRDLDGAKAFYGAVFGWATLGLDGAALTWTLPGYGDHLERLNPGTRERMAAMGAVKGFEDVVASILPIPADHEDMPAHWTVTFATDNADATAEKASALGGKLLAPPFDAPWVRMTIIADPQGATFIASQFAPENRDVPAPESASVSASA
jgi:uncharacterized protein